MPDFSYAVAFIVGTFLECVMYGFFLALLIAACYVQWDRYSKGRGVSPVIVFTIAFFWFTITTNCLLSVHRSTRAIFYAPPGVTVYEYIDPPYPTVEIFRLVLFQIQTAVGDIIMVHRMYHIYQRNLYMCIVPSMTIAALFAVSFGMGNQLRHLTTLQDVKSVEAWSSACFCLTIFNSLFTTIAISFRLWRVHRETTRANIRRKSSVILRAMKVLIESAALWTVFVVMNFLVFLAKSNLVYIFLAMTGPAVGISFCLIIVRLGQILPESRHESWHMSIPTPDTQTPGVSSGQLSELVFPSDPKVDRSDDRPKFLRASFTLPAPMS